MTTDRGHTRRYPRTARVNEVVLEVLADEVERLSDPRLGFVTLTGVEVSPDLREATVYYSALGSRAVRAGEMPEGASDGPESAEAREEREQTAVALRSAAPHLRTVLGRQVRLKYLPRLTFREDPAIRSGRRVEEILRRIHEAGGPAGADGEGAGAGDAGDVGDVGDGP